MDRSSTKGVRGEGCDEQTETLLQVFITHTQELQALGGRGEVGGDLGRFQQHSLEGEEKRNRTKIVLLSSRNKEGARVSPARRHKDCDPATAAPAEVAESGEICLSTSVRDDRGHGARTGEGQVLRAADRAQARTHGTSRNTRVRRGAPATPLLSPTSNAADRRNQSCLSSRLTLCLSPCWPSQEAPPPFWRSVTSCLSPHALARRF